MRLSLRGEYALRALIALGESYSPEVIPIQVISRQQDIPKRFLEQILNDLKTSGVVESKRGIAGGYRLARPPKEITLAQVIREIESGILSVKEQAKSPKLRNAADASQRAILSVMKDVRQAIEQVLEKATLADLCERARRLRAPVEYSDYAI